MVREDREKREIRPCVKQIDTVAGKEEQGEESPINNFGEHYRSEFKNDEITGEWPAQTNYLYFTYNGQKNDVDFNLVSHN